MTWDKKMKKFVELVLNNGYDDIFSLDVIDENNYTLLKENKPHLTTTTSDHLPSHWRTHGKMTIEKIMNEEMSWALSEVHRM